MGSPLGTGAVQDKYTLEFANVEVALVGAYGAAAHNIDTVDVKLPTSRILRALTLNEYV